MIKTLIITVLLGFLLVPLSNVFALETDPTAITRESSYVLFWPIVAGQVKGESLYILKNLKENLREKFIFNDIKKAEYQITLSEKRVVEAEKLLLEKKDSLNAKSTLAAAQDAREKVVQLIQNAKDNNQSMVDVQDRFRISLEKQKMLLQFLITQVSSEEKQNLEKNIESLNSVLAKFN